MIAGFLSLSLSLVLAQAAPDTGEIRGRVIDKDTGRPIARAVVRVTSMDDRARAAELPATTDEDGTFRFAALPAGRYSGFAHAPRHLFTTIPGAPATPRELVVAKAQTLQIVVAMPRAYAITFRIVDSFGDPLSGLGVSIHTATGGMVTSGYERQSDDNGRVRLSGLGPGRYTACVDPSLTGVSVSRTEPASTRDRLLRRCYPAAADEAAAEPITIARGDLDGVEIRVRRGRTYSISGTILDESGAPASGSTAGLVTYRDGGSSSTGGVVDSAGRFRFSNVQPGTYAIEASSGGQAAFVEVPVAEDVEHLVVTMHRSYDVGGRVVLDDPSAALVSRPNYAPMSISSQPADTRLPRTAGLRVAMVRHDRTFTLEAQFGQRVFAVENVPPGWFVKRMQYGAVDALDRPVDVKSGNDTLDIVLSNRGATIKGTVADVIDKRMARAQVFLFRAPADKDDAPRFAGALTSATGNYTFGPLRDGDYLIVAVPVDVRFPNPQLGDRDYIARLAALGERVTVAESDQRTVDLRVATVR